MRKTRKNKLLLEDFSSCHPRISLRGKRRKTARCLPPSVDRELSRQLRIPPSSLFSSLGCKEGEEHCLIDKSPFSDEKKKELRKNYLRPRRPRAWIKDPDTWLDNYNIKNVMKQYEETYPWFKFLGVLPMDFSAPDPYRTNGQTQCLYKEACEIQLKREYEKGIRGIGIIFNLDPHFKGGSHWVALYIDLKNIHKPGVYYFDSNGVKTPPLVARLMRSFTLQIRSCTLAYNARRFQYSNTECGMFSMYFIICMIHGVPFDHFCKTAVSDQMMLNLRKKLFTL